MDEIETLIVSSDSYEVLANIIKFILEQIKEPIVDFRFDENGYLVFCSEPVNEHTSKYPFIPTIPVIVEQIKNYVNTPKYLEKCNVRPSGYEEDYNIGWTLFTNQYYKYNDEYNIDEYEAYRDIFAIKPTIIEYGK